MRNAKTEFTSSDEDATIALHVAYIAEVPVFHVVRSSYNWPSEVRIYRRAVHELVISGCRVEG